MLYKSRDWLQISQYYVREVQEHKEHNGPMAMEASVGQHGSPYPKPVLQIIPCNYCPHWKWPSLGKKDLKAPQKEQAKASHLPGD